MPIPDFVAALRAQVGPSLLWLPGVSGVILNPDGHILLTQRADSGLWAIVCGILEPGEDPAAGLVREAREETAVPVQVQALVAVTVTEPIEYPGGDRSQYLDLCFVGRAVDAAAASAARVNDDESTAVGWFDPAALPGSLDPMSGERIEHCLRFLANPDTGTFFVNQP